MHAKGLILMRPFECPPTETKTGVRKAQKRSNELCCSFSISKNFGSLNLVSQ